MKLEYFICEHCFYGEQKVVDVEVPIYSTSHLTKTVHRLAVYCKYYFNFKHKKVKECEHYRPRAGKIDKKITQTTLKEF